MSETNEIITKKCSICNNILGIGLFPLHKTGADGYATFCRKCKNDKNKIRREILRNRDDVDIIYPKTKRCYNCGKTRIAKRFHKNRRNRDGLDDRCKHCSIGRYDPKRYKTYYENNKDRKIYQVSVWSKKMARESVVFRIRRILRSRIDSIVRRYVLRKTTEIKRKTEEYIGCGILELVGYMESLFYDNIESGEKMTWDNYGLYGWHIDHIKPLSAFDLTKPKQIMKASHYSNLQPMWAKENLRKGAKYDAKTQHKSG